METIINTNQTNKEYATLSVQQILCKFAKNQPMRNNIIFGVVLSIGITIMVMIPRLTLARGSEYIDTTALATFVMLLTTWFGHLGLLNSKKYKKLVPRIWIQSILSILIITVAVYYILNLISPIFETKRESLLSNRFEDHIKIWNFFRVLIWNIIYHWILFSQRVIVEKKDAELKASRAEKLAIEAKLTSFREQLSPHFMFNSLNTLSSIIRQEDAQRFVEQLASVYRYLLESREKNSVSLKDELSFVRSYWHILKERFGDAIELDIEFNSDISTKQIPPLALQTLVENAVKHNVATQNKPLQISIKETDTSIIIKNNIQLKSNPIASTGVGLYNLSERYDLLYNKEIEIINSENFFTVKLPMV